MTEKDLQQLNDSELEAVTGGRLEYAEQQAFYRIDNASSAAKYLISCGIRPGTTEFNGFMKEWELRHQ